MTHLLTITFYSLRLSLSYSTAAAFAPQQAAQTSTALNAEGRREFFGKAAAFGAAAIGAGVMAPSPAQAVRDYENIGYLGGGQVVDINNANIRVYLKMPGMYPGPAGKIASNGPYNSVSDIYNIPGLSSEEKNVMKKYESRFTALKPSADYVIDRINNGLYR